MNWFERLLGKQEKSGATAKQRLQMVLIHDRADVSPGLLEQIKDDIIEVIAKRLEINPDNVVVNLDNTAQESRLVAEIPLLHTTNGRRRAAVQ
ncbi:MAG: cell division topological specificity factor MinE [Ardenticatenaceae bacterium]|nr:cell division topological specificity factor MinE [Ardenticatenaceae bacterium]MCB8947113.1 cell division topological specificity factor MinE [Ardenticatenaceae bacterium]